MIQTINFSKFCDGFFGDYADHFSYSAKKLLFEHFESLEEETDEQIEFDPIALCCEYQETSWEGVKENYNIEAETKEDVINFLEERTQFIGETAAEDLIFATF